MEIILTKGVAGPAIYFNGHRIAGPKPWGGGTASRTLEATDRDIREALRGTKVDYAELDRRLAELQEAVRWERECNDQVWPVYGSDAYLELYSTKNAARAAVDALVWAG